MWWPLLSFCDLPDGGPAPEERGTGTLGIWEVESKKSAACSGVSPRTTASPCPEGIPWLGWELGSRKGLLGKRVQLPLGIDSRGRRRSSGALSTRVE